MEMWKRYVVLGGAPDSFMDKVIVGCWAVVMPPAMIALESASQDR